MVIKTDRSQIRHTEKDGNTWREAAASLGLSLSAWVVLTLNEAARKLARSGRGK